MILTNVKKKLMHYTWDLAFFYFEGTQLSDFSPKNINIVVNPFKCKWFADPFILDFNDKEIELLVEEYDLNIKRGRIARIVVDKKRNVISECHIVLDQPTHLSFPAIYRENGRTYVIPENSESGSLFIYEYDREKDKLVAPKLLHPEPLTDAIIDFQDEKYKMYATCLPEPNGNILFIYESDALMGPYHKIAEASFVGNTARMAGYIIHKKEMNIRPAQDCNREYGEAVIFYDGDKEINRILAPKFKYSGLHTFNTFNGLGVLDLKVYDCFLLVKIWGFIKKFFR